MQATATSSQARRIACARSAQNVTCYAKTPARAHAVDRRSCIARAAPTPAGTAQSLDAQGQEVWEGFARHFSGEWEGVTASFSPSGVPQQLPEYYVPSAFRDWGVELYDWQSQCSCNVVDGRISYKLRRLMPTVGCEADAIAFTEEDSGSGSSSTSEAADPAQPGTSVAVLGDGSFVAGATQLPAQEGPSKVKLQACFALPGAVRRRLRLEHVLQRSWKTGEWSVASVELHREQYEGPYTGKRELAGCGGGQQPFAKTAAMTPEQLEGTWRIVSFVSSGAACQPAASAALGGADGAEPGVSLSELSGSGDVPEGGLLALLPLGAWSLVTAGPEAGSFRAEAGVLLPDAAAAMERHVASFVYQNGSLSSVRLGRESRS